MKVVMHSLVAAPSLIGRYQHAGQYLRSAGIDFQIRTGVPSNAVVEGADVLISHNWISDAVRQRPGLRCYGGKDQTRPQHLALLSSLGFSTMEWTTVGNLDAALAQLSAWGVDKLILKRSYTSNGMGFHVLTANQPTYTTWDFEKDVLCKEVNPACGKVFKAELFAGKLMLGFVLKKEPITQRLVADDPCPDGARQLLPYRPNGQRPDSSHREPWDFTSDEIVALENLSAALTAEGFGYVSLDLMRRPDGQLVAIELNTGSVASWWSDQFAFVRERFSAALLNLVQQN